MSTKPGVPYSVIKGGMLTLDLLLFKGSDIVSKTIVRVESMQCGVESRYSHVGICVRGEDLCPPVAGSGEEAWLKPDKLYIFETTMSGALGEGVCDVNGKAHLGVQMRSLDDVVEAYDANPDVELAWCPLRESVRPGDKAVSKIIRNVYQKYNGMDYDASVIDLAGAAGIKVARDLRDNPVLSKLRDFFCTCLCCLCCRKDRAAAAHASEWLFCSELVAAIYKYAGILPESVNPADVMPQDFCPNPSDPSKTCDADGAVPQIFDKLVVFHRG